MRTDSPHRRNQEITRMPPNLNEPNLAIASRPLRDTGATLLTLSGFAAAFGVASCCGLPFLLATMGIGSAWLFGIASLVAPHRPLLLAIGAICLTGGVPRCFGAAGRLLTPAPPAGYAPSPPCAA
jgi:hypothetical protein